MDIADILHLQRKRYYAHVTYFDQMVIAYGELSWWMRFSIHLSVVGGAMTIGFWSPLLAGLVYGIYLSLSGFLWAQYIMMERRFEQMTVDIEVAEKNLNQVIEKQESALIKMENIVVDAKHTWQKAGQLTASIISVFESTNRVDIHDSSVLKARAWAYIQKMEAGNIESFSKI